MTGIQHSLIGVALLALISVLIGLTFNLGRSRPLPWVYRSPEQRLHEIVDRLRTDFISSGGKIEPISLNDLRGRMEKKEAMILLDARPPIFYRMGHLSGAWPLSREEFEKDYLALRDKLNEKRSKPIIVYCSDANCHDSAWVAQAILALGFGDVSVFSGGYAEWKQADLPIVRE